MAHKITLNTVDDLIRCLSSQELKGKPLCQVITVVVNMGGAGANMRKIYFNQLDKFTWDYDNNELGVEV